MHIDVHLAAEGVKIRVNNPEYWKRYIEVASEGAVSVSEAAEGLQFFYIKGGFEGFLQKSHAGNMLNGELG